jgi:SPP1 family predicted phage head-tail adaptor
MNAGQLDRKVTLETLTTTRDSFGQPIETWTELADVWAKKIDRVASEVTSGGQVVEVVRTEWIIRHRSDFDSRYRIKTSDSTIQELITNKNFNATSTTKILDGSFPSPNSNWILHSSTINGGSATITGLGSLTSTGNNWSVSQNVIDIGVRSYKVTFTAKRLTGTGAMYGGIGYNNIFNQVVTGEFVTYTFFQNNVVTEGNGIRVAFGGVLATGEETANTFEIKDVVVQELGENWTVYTDNDGGVEFNSQGVKITNGAANGQAKISQSSVFESGKSYKFTYTIVEYNGGDIGLTGQSAAMSRDVGTHVEYIVGGATSDFILGKANTNTDVTVTDISLKKIGTYYYVTGVQEIGRKVGLKITTEKRDRE